MLWWWYHLFLPWCCSIFATYLHPNTHHTNHQSMRTEVYYHDDDGHPPQRIENMSWAVSVSVCPWACQISKVQLVIELLQEHLFRCDQLVILCLANVLGSKILGSELWMWMLWGYDEMSSCWWESKEGTLWKSSSNNDCSINDFVITSKKDNISQLKYYRAKC